MTSVSRRQPAHDPPDTAIVDIDGTLVDTNYHHALAWYRAFRLCDIVVPIWRIHRHIGMGGDQLVGAVAGAAAEERHGEDLRKAWTEDHYLDLLDAHAVIDAWTTSEDVEATKPAPDLLAIAAAKVDGDRPVVIGDSIWNCVAARRIDVPAVAVLTGGFSNSQLRTAGAGWVFDSPDELRANLDETPLR